MTEKHYDLHKLLEEIKSTEGLPEKLSTEAQLWDEIMKKETFLMPEQLFPLIKEIHGKVYEKGTKISPLATEFSVQRSDTKEITSIRADITVLVDKTDIYHFECEIENDGTMVMRMFEYDVHIALSYSEIADEEEIANGKQSMGKIMKLKFPYSAVLYLQDNGNIPEELKCRIEFQDGGSYEYKIPVLKVQSYTLEEIKEKHLCVLIPFLPLRFRKKMPPARKNCSVTKEELTSFYAEIILLLEEEVAAGYLSEMNRNAIISLLNKSLIRVFYKNEKLLKEVVGMTEPILELEFEKYEKIINEKIKTLDEMKREISGKDKELSERGKELLEKDKELSERGKELLEKDKELSERGKELLEKDKELSERGKELLEKDKELSERVRELLEKDKELSERVRELLEKDKELSERSSELREKDAEIAELRKKLEEAERKLEL